MTVICLVPGLAEGSPLVLAEPLSFWGGFDAVTGRVIDRWHPDRGRCLSGVVLMMERSRGSSSASSVLAEAIRLGTSPAAILLTTRDAILTTGALVAAELYQRACPVLCLTDPALWQACAQAPRLRILATAGAARIETLDDLPMPDRPVL
jgi:uncharacterized protein